MTPVHYGLRLTLGGAPNVWHTATSVDGRPVPGLFHPEIITPLEALELTDEEGRYIAENAPHLELVEVPKGKLKGSREAVLEAMGIGRRAVMREARGPRADDRPITVARLHTEFAATEPPPKSVEVADEIIDVPEEGDQP